jgi:hypothetical protein
MIAACASTAYVELVAVVIIVAMVGIYILSFRHDRDDDE